MSAQSPPRLQLPESAPLQYRRGNVVLAVTVVKHADTGVSSCRPRTLVGQSEHQLSHRGIKQAALVSQRLKKTEWDAVYCSDAWQTKQTALELTKLVPGRSITYEPRLRERNLGDLTGLAWPEAKARLNEEGKLFEEFISDNGGESAQEFEDRVLDVYADIIARHLLGPTGFPLSREGSTDLAAADDKDKDKDPLKTTPGSSSTKLAPDLLTSSGHYKGISMGPQVSDTDARRMSAILPSPVRTPSSAAMPVPSSFVGRRASNTLGLSASASSTSAAGTSTGAMPTGPMSPAQAAATYAARKGHSGALGTSGPKPTSATTTPHKHGPGPAPARPPHKRVNVLLYTHGGVIQALFSHLLNELAFDLDAELQPGFPKDASVYRFEINRVRTDVPGDWEWVGHVTAMNVVSHYAALATYKSPEQIKAEGEKRKAENLAQGKGRAANKGAVQSVAAQGASGSQVLGSPNVFRRLQAAFQANGGKSSGGGSPGSSSPSLVHVAAGTQQVGSVKVPAKGKVLPPLPTIAK